MQLEARRQGIYDQLVPLLAADPGREFDRAAFERVNAETSQYIAIRPGQIRGELAAHGF